MSAHTGISPPCPEHFPSKLKPVDRAAHFFTVRFLVLANEEQTGLIAPVDNEWGYFSERQSKPCEKGLIDLQHFL